MGYLIGDPHKAKTQSVYSKQERNPPRATGVYPELVCPQIRSPTQGGPDASGSQSVGSSVWQWEGAMEMKQTCLE